MGLPVRQPRLLAPRSHLGRGRPAQLSFLHKSCPSCGRHRVVHALSLSQARTGASEDVVQEFLTELAMPLHATFWPPLLDTRPHWVNTCTSGFASFPTPGDQLWTLAGRRCTNHTHDHCDLHAPCSGKFDLAQCQQPHKTPSQSDIGHNCSLVILNSANLCISNAPHFTGGPKPLSHALLPSGISRSKAADHECRFLTALMWAAADL